MEYLTENSLRAFPFRPESVLPTWWGTDVLLDAQVYTTTPVLTDAVLSNVDSTFYEDTIVFTFQLGSTTDNLLVPHSALVDARSDSAGYFSATTEHAQYQLVFGPGAPKLLAFPPTGLSAYLEFRCVKSLPRKVTSITTRNILTGDVSHTESDFRLTFHDGSRPLGANMAVTANAAGVGLQVTRAAGSGLYDKCADLPYLPIVSLNKRQSDKAGNFTMSSKDCFLFYPLVHGTAIQNYCTAGCTQPAYDHVATVINNVVQGQETNAVNAHNAAAQALQETIGMFQQAIDPNTHNVLTTYATLPPLPRANRLARGVRDVGITCATILPAPGVVVNITANLNTTPADSWTTTGVVTCGNPIEFNRTFSREAEAPATLSLTIEFVGFCTYHYSYPV